MRAILMASSFLSTVAFAPADVGTAEARIVDKTHNQPPQALPDLTAEEQATVWDEGAWAAKVEALRPEIEGLQHTSDSLSATLAVMAADLYVHARKGYTYMDAEGHEHKQLPKQLTADDIRDKLRKALKVQDLGKPMDKNSRIAFKVNTVNTLLTVAAKAAVLVGEGYFGYTTARFKLVRGQHPQAVPDDYKAGADETVVRRIAAPWANIEPYIKVGKGDVKNDDKKLVPLSSSNITISYSAAVGAKTDGGFAKVRLDQYGKPAKGADQEAPAKFTVQGENLKAFLESTYLKLNEMAQSEPAYTDFETASEILEKLVGLLDDIGSAMDQAEDGHRAEWFKDKHAADAAKHVGGIANKAKAMAGR